MKRLLSIFVAAMILIGTMSSALITCAADVSPAQEIFNALYSSYGENIKKATVTPTSSDLSFWTNSTFKSEVTGSSGAIASLYDNNMIGNILSDKYGITKSVAINVMNQVLALTPSDLVNLFSDLKSGSLSKSTSALNNLDSAIKTAAAPAHDKLTAAIPDENRQTDFIIDVMKALMKSMTINFNMGSMSVSVAIDKDALYSNAQDVESTYSISNDNSFTTDKTAFQTAVASAESKLVAPINYIANNSNSNAKILAYEILTGQAYSSDGGGGGGGSPIINPPSQPSTPVTNSNLPDGVTVPAPVEVAVTDSATVTSNGTTDQITIDSSKIASYISTLTSQAAGKDAVLNIQVSTTNANKIIDIPATVISSVSSASVALKITTSDVSVTLDQNTLKGLSVPSNGTISISMTSGSTSDVSGAISQVPSATAVGVLNLGMNIKAADSTTTAVTNFSGNVTVSVAASSFGNSDLLYVYYCNGNTAEPVSGKVKDGQLTFSTTHFSQYAIVSRNITFPDLTANVWPYTEVTSMAAKNIVSGSNGKAMVNTNVTRAEFAKMIINMLELKTSSYTGGYSDVKTSDWFAGYVQTASDKGIIKGYDGKFNPNAYITRAEMAIMLTRAINATVTKDSATILSGFTDCSKLNSEYFNDIAKAVCMGLMQGKSSTIFDPNANATRGEAITVIYRAYKTY